MNSIVLPESDGKPSRFAVWRQPENVVTAAFGGAMLLMVLLAAIGVHQLRQSVETANWVEHTHVVLRTIDRTAVSFADVLASVRTYVITGEDAALLGREDAMSRVESGLTDLRELTRDSPRQTAALAQLTADIHERIALANETVVKRQTEGFEAAQQLILQSGSRVLMLRIKSQFDGMADYETRLLREREVSELHARQRVMGIGALLVATVLLTVFAGVVRLRRELRISRNLLVSLAAANRELESFSYSVSHDLRSPLRAIDGYSLMLLEDYGEKLDGEARRYLDTIRAGSQRMGELIDDLLTFSRLSRQPMKRLVVDMQRLAEIAIKEARGEAGAAPPTIKIQPMPEAEGDPALLQQVLSNLVANAVKYSSKVAEPVIEIGAQKVGERAVYFVRDNGAGFDMQYVGKLFGVFQRLHGQDEFAGTGVGLAIVHRIVTRHGGRVWAEAAPNQGATFFFTLG